MPTRFDSNVEHGHTQTPMFEGMDYTANRMTPQLDDDAGAAEDIHVDMPHALLETGAGTEQQDNTGDLPMIEANHFIQAYQRNTLLHVCSNGRWKQMEVCNNLE